MNIFTWFVIIWVISIGITYWMLYYTASNLVVTFAKNGLLVNPNKMPHSDGKFITLLSFIPIINIFFGFKWEPTIKLVMICYINASTFCN